MARHARLLVFPLLAASLLAPAAERVDSHSIRERTIEIQAGDFAFSPARVEVDPGSLVTLRLESTDFVHGLYLEGYDVEVLAEPGRPGEVRFAADRSGVFRFRCSISCGALHPFMTGSLRVGPSPFLPTLALAAAAAMVGGLVVWRRPSRPRAPAP